VFNVRSVVVWWLSFNVHPQTELAINIYTIVSDVHRGVENTHCLVSGVGHDVANTHSLVSDVRHEVKNTQAIVSELNCNVVNTNTIVSDIHRNMLKREGGADGQQRVVSDTHALYIAEQIFTTAQTQNRSAAKLSVNSVSHI